MSDNHNWERLLHEAQKGNEIMYSQFLTKISNHLKTYLIFKLRSDIDAQDVLQDVLMSVHSARHTYEYPRPVKPWLYTIVQSRLMDHFRKRSRSATFLSSGTEQELSILIAEAEVSQLEVSDFKSALSFLSDEQCEILRAIKFEGLSIKEISGSRDMSESAVKVVAHRAYKLFFEKMGVER